MHWRGLLGGGLALALLACGGRSSPVITRLVEARRLAAELQVSFSHASDATDRAVMADTDEASIRFAREADDQAVDIQREASSIEPMIQTLGYADELKLLGEFRNAFSKYRALDREILSLAVENTNLKAQRLSFGPAYDAANALGSALQPVLRASDGSVRALASAALLAVREIEVLEAPHIAAADDQAMTALESQMNERIERARSALGELRQRGVDLDGGEAAFEHFLELHQQLIALSRRNTNVRSLALALGQKRTLEGVCQDELHALNDRLAQHDFIATR